MKKRRIDKLGRALNSIKLRTPRIFSRFCPHCDCYVKGEPMWKHHSYTYGATTYWTCLSCAPAKIDVIHMYKTDFKDVDTLPLIDDEARAKREAYLNYT